MNKDLTVGKPSAVLWRFCLPLFGSIVFQQLYNIADSLVAGKFINENALAAVGNSYEVTLIFIAFAFGCNIGCSVIVSQLFGAKEFEKMKTAVSTSVIASGILCVILMAFGLIFSDKLLNAIKTPAKVFDDSKLYLDIYIWGLPFVFFYNTSTGIFSALGDSKTPFLFLAVSSTANVLVDILFVKTFNMGVAGVAWATFLCQAVSCILAVIVVFVRLSKIKTEKPYKLFSWKLLKKIAIIAIPSILQQSFISVGNIIIQGLINGFGAGVMAGYSAAIKLNNLVITSFATIGNGISNYTAQNVGARLPHRVKEGFTAGVRLVLIICLPIVPTYLIFGKTLLNFFLDNPSPKAVSSAIDFLRIVSPLYFIASIKLVGDGILRGVGEMKEFMAATFTDLTLRVILAWLFSKRLGSIGIWLAWPVGWSVSTIMSYCFYKRCIRKLERFSSFE